MKTSGEFDVDLRPLDAYIQARGGVKFSRMSVKKQYTGGLVATSRGEMLSAMTTAQNSAGYVAIEQVSGNLQGKEGSFVLQHLGIKDRGKERLTLEVIPGSGTGQLGGISGKMLIVKENGQHIYDFEYELQQN